MKPFYWLNDESRTFLDRGYLLDGVSAEDRIREIAETAETLLQGMYERENGTGPDYPPLIDSFAERFEHNMAQGYYSLASPVWANFGLDRGLPISCFGSYIGDSMESILYTHAEVGAMTKYGGGTSGYFGDIRPRGEPIGGGESYNGKSNGSYSFTKLFDTVIDVVSQGETRRGQFAGYIDIEHDDIEEWLNIRTEGNPIQDMYWGVCIGDDWMQQMIDGDAEKREVWARIIELRINQGVPYLFFRDNANRGRPQVYKDKGYDIKASNLCSEVMQPSNEDESFVCCLSSMNAARYDSWKDTDAVRVLTMFLDAVMEEFVQKSRDVRFLERAHRYSRRHRAIGIGVLGWHDLLQSKMLPFGSWGASQLNAELFRRIKDESYAASRKMAADLGTPAVMNGYGRRNSVTMAVAPTKSSSFILGQVSPSIEPLKSNYYVRDRAKIKTTYRNQHLERVLIERGMNTDEVWESIGMNDGSVQHLDGLSDRDKEVFKTFVEINQGAIISQAAQRQQYIDQGQSLNVAIDPEQVSIRDINALYIEAWRSGLKSMYYQNNVNAAQKLSRDILNCAVCES